MSVSPLQINFMLTCYFSPDPVAQLGEHHWDSPAGQEAREWMIVNGLVDGKHKATDKGRAWVKMICATPLPVKVWLHPSTAQEFEAELA